MYRCTDVQVCTKSVHHTIIDQSSPRYCFVTGGKEVVCSERKNKNQSLVVDRKGQKEMSGPCEVLESDRRVYEDTASCKLSNNKKSRYAYS